MKVLILGASGMLGSAMFKTLSKNESLQVVASLRDHRKSSFFDDSLRANLIAGIDILDQDSLVQLLTNTRPDVVINCVGLIKQLGNAKDPLVALPLNAMFPHRLARLCALLGARVVHISTDCVFDGKKGNYLESDLSNAEDLYGKSKYMGELHDYPHAVTLRTSIIGHELDSKHSLVDWFLSQEGEVKGFSKAIFSGLPTVELAKVVECHVLPKPELSGLYHVAAAPISKLDLLTLVAQEYGKNIRIVPDSQLVIDRSLNGIRFREASGYTAPAWPELIRLMKKSH
jgi:dTDP-4-dehydrorhamnose reductase